MLKLFKGDWDWLIAILAGGILAFLVYETHIAIKKEKELQELRKKYKKQNEKRYRIAARKILKEKLHLQSYLGMGLIILGVVLISIQ